MLELIDIFALCRERLTDSGLKIFSTEDAAQAMQMVHASGKQYVTPHVWPAYNDLTQDSYFWLFLLDIQTDRIEAVIAARKDKLQPGGYTEFWANHYLRLKQTEFGGIIDRSKPSLADIYVHGDCIYIGDYYCNPKRKINQTTFLAIAHIHSMIKWPEASVHYAYISEKDANRGQAFRLLFNNTSRHAHRWLEKPLKRSNTDVIVWITRSDLDHELRNLFSASDTTSESQNKSLPVLSLHR